MIIKDGHSTVVLVVAAVTKMLLMLRFPKEGYWMLRLFVHIVPTDMFFNVVREVIVLGSDRRQRCVDPADAPARWHLLSLLGRCPACPRPMASPVADAAAALGTILR